jgi:hypothetical protein
MNKLAISIKLQVQDAHRGNIHMSTHMRYFIFLPSLELIWKKSTSTLNVCGWNT